MRIDAVIEILDKALTNLIDLRDGSAWTEDCQESFKEINKLYNEAIRQKNTGFPMVEDEPVRILPIGGNSDE